MSIKWNGGDAMDKRDDEFFSTVSWLVSIAIVIAGFALLCKP